MVLVERHSIVGTPEIIRLCSESKDLYNRCCFMMRQARFAGERLPDINILIAAVKDLDCFKNLHNTKTAKQTVRKCITDWSNFKKSLNAWFKDSSKFLAKPQPPGYKRKLAQVIFYNETILKKPAREGIIIPTNKCFSVKSDKKFQQVVITPKRFGFVVEISYEAEKEDKGKKAETSAQIDIGVNNLCAMTEVSMSQTPGKLLRRPILVNGRIVKSFNRWFNMKPTSQRRLRKRYFRIENYFHHASKLIVQACLEDGIRRIIIGRNKGWKQGIKKRMRQKDRQNFQWIPFRLLLEKIKYKAELVGIEVRFTEEAYTSKASFLDGDPLPEYEKGKPEPEFSGKRTHRGLYVSKPNTGEGFALNADVNGSLNVGRKVIPQLSLGTIGNRSLAARPVRINPLKAFAHIGGIDEGRLMPQTQKSTK